MKERLDNYLVQLKLAPSREKAKAIILAGEVLVNNVVVDKPATIIKDDADIRIKTKQLKYVSRAGFKLEKAIKDFNLDVNDLVCLDIGSSTGGFTDCLLQNGARFVYALDVGTNQLDWKLRNNNLVLSLEKTNFRYVKKEIFTQSIQFACCDVSFISLDKIIPKLSEILSQGSKFVALIKPQFEAGKGLTEHGKITNPEIQIDVIKKIINVGLENMFCILDLSYSPILGNKKSNIEFICLMEKVIINPINLVKTEKVVDVVRAGWLSLSGTSIAK